MDFLDPRKKRTRTIRLMIGYVLMAIAIGLGTIILVYGANGYGIDTKTGQITENGLLFVDSKPGGANIYLNGVDQKNTTSARMILTSGEYELILRKPGYREWKRNFTLQEHSIKRYVYPFLFPEQLAPKTLKTYSALPQLITETPDRRWLLVQSQVSPRAISFDMYNTGDLQEPSRTVTLSAGLLTNYDPATSRLVEVEWANDNIHLLAQHISSAGNEFIIIDRTNPTDSINVNKTLNYNPDQVSLRDKRVNELYVYDQDARTLRIADVNQKRLEPPLLSNVYGFKSYGRSLISYVTSAGAPEGRMVSRIWENGKTYPLNIIKPGNKYLLDIAEFQGNWYYVAVSDADERVAIYKNPLSNVKDGRTKTPPPMFAFAIPNLTKVSFSANTRFLNVQSGQKFGVYDFEAEEKYQYDLPAPIVEPIVWMDGHRLIGNSNGSVVVMDYNSTNQQTLVPTTLAKGGYFSRDYNQFYTLVPVAGNDSVNLVRIDMRAGDDLPAELR